MLGIKKSDGHLATVTVKFKNKTYSKSSLSFFSQKMSVKDLSEAPKLIRENKTEFIVSVIALANMWV